VGGAALAAFAIIYNVYPDSPGRARTAAFCVLAYSELLRAFAARSMRFTLGQLGLFTNPYLFGAIALSAVLQLTVVTMPFAQPVFEAATHFVWEWLLIALLSLVPVSAIELWKLWRKARVSTAAV
jgi:Ca2+-transporting ATPase